MIKKKKDKKYEKIKKDKKNEKKLKKTKNCVRKDHNYFDDGLWTRDAI